VTSLLRSLSDRVLVGEVLPAGPLNKIPVPIVGRGGGSFAESLTSGGGQDGGDKEQQAAAMGANGTLYAIVGGIAFDVSVQEWQLFKRAPSGKKEDRVEVPPMSHPSQALFEQPNPYMPWQEFCEVVQQHMELTGEGWPIITRMLGMPGELWPIYPHRMVPIPSPTDFLAGYVYLSPGGERIPLSRDEVTQLRQPHPLNLFRGLSAVQAIGAELGAGVAASRWNENFFRNSAMPGGIIEQDTEAAGLSDTEFAAFALRWREAHQGLNNAHRVAVLEAGMKWVATSYSLKDLQFVELRNMSRDIVREVYRYPSAYLGTVEDANRANMEAQAVYYGEHILKPRLTRWKSWRNAEIMPMFGGDWRSYEWDFVDPTPPNSEADNAMWTAKSGAFGAFTTAGVDGKAAAEAMELPERIAEGWSKPEPPPVAAPPGGAGGGKPKPKSIAWAPPVWAEASSPELAALDAQWQAAVDDAVQQWQADVAPEQRAAVRDAVVTAVAAGALGGLATLAVPALGADLLLAAMVALATAGAASVVAEAAAAGVVGLAQGVADAAVLAQAADAAAGLVAQGMALSAGREALRLTRPDSVADDVAADVVTMLEEASDRALRDQLGGALTRAQNAGRLATLAMPSPSGWRMTLYADETLDANTCKPCREINGSELPTWEAAQLAYGGAGYLFCEGGVRCRGTAIGIWTRAV
jgi:HK97 family phage portal protein